MLDFPVNYGDDYTQTYFTDITIASPDPAADSIRMKNTIEDHTTVDAYGSLTTPLGTFDALRSKEIQISYDTVWAMLFGNWLAVSAEVDTSISYSWWTNDVSVGFMLFSINMDGVTGNVSDISYLLNSIQGIHSTEITNANVYPNPASNMVNFAFNKVISGQMNIYNQAGQLVKQAELSGEANHRFSVALFPAGVYVYKVLGKTNTILYQGKFIKQ